MKKYFSFLTIKRYILNKFFGFELGYSKDMLNTEHMQVENPEYSEEDIKPYIYEYSYNIDSSQYFDRSHYLNEKYKNELRPMDEEAYKKIINEKINLDKFTLDGKEEVLYKVWKDANLINDILEPLREMNVSYTLDLTGGCVRDFLLDNHAQIKDLDFMLSIGYVDDNDLLKYKIEDFFTSKELEAVNWSEVEIPETDGVVRISDEAMKAKLVSLCLNKFNQKYVLFDHSKKRENKEAQFGGYVMLKNDRLISVTKLEDEKFNYPIDILLTDFIKPDFLKDFDFDICKASICFVNDSVSKDFPSHHKQLINRCIGEADFWADVINKRITYNVDNRVPTEIDRSFNDHYKRIQKKYPDYTLNIIGSNEESIKYIKSIILSKELNETLDKKIEIKPRKMKI